jgi:predicted transcriptional regulator of viral defense system
MARIGRRPINTRERPKRSDVGIDLVRLLSSEGDRIFSTERARELSERIALKESYLVEALYHLRRNGWIVSLRRGLYAISPSAPGATPTHEFEIAMALVNPAAISHWSALHYHALTEQAPRNVFVMTTTQSSVPRVRGTRAPHVKSGYPVGKILYRFIQVKPERFFGTEKVWVGEAGVTMTDPERTLLDGLSMPQYCGDFAEVLHAFEVRGAKLDLNRIIDYALRLDVTTAKRLGWVLEKQGIDPLQLEPLRQASIKGYRKLDPTGPRKGPYNAGWMIQENLPGKLA